MGEFLRIACSDSPGRLTTESPTMLSEEKGIAFGLRPT
jgi:hypothetical protein